MPVIPVHAHVQIHGFDESLDMSRCKTYNITYIICLKPAVVLKTIQSSKCVVGGEVF